jgi:CheY-like chemotaxis protein
MISDRFGTDATGDSPTPAAPKTILLVDDTDESRSITKWFLGSLGYMVHSLPNAVEALAVFNPCVHALVVTDNSMPGMTGHELAHIVKMRSPSTPVLMYSGNFPADRSGLDSVVQKPRQMVALREAINRLLCAAEKISAQPSLDTA